MIQALLNSMPFSVGIFLLSCCSNISKINSNNEITGFTIRYNIPIQKADGSVLDFADSIHVYYYQDLVMYKFHYFFDSSLVDTNGVEELKLAERRHSYFVFAKDSLYGNHYFPYERDSTQRLLVDSMLIQHAFINMNIHEVFPKNDLQLIYSKTDSTDMLTEIYVPGPARTTPPNGSDTIYFYYDTQNPRWAYSLSTKLDSIKRKKLVKYRLTSTNFRDENIHFNYKEIALSFHEILTFDRQKLIAFLESRNKYLLK